jgi:hypothetical protein
MVEKQQSAIEKLVKLLRLRGAAAKEQAKLGPGYLEGKADGFLEAAYELGKLLESEKATSKLSSSDWKLCASETIFEGNLKGRSCYGAVVSETGSNITSLVLDFPMIIDGDLQHWVLCRFYNLDYDVIVDSIRKLKAEFDLIEVITRRWDDTVLKERLEAVITVSEKGCGFVSMSEPTKELERLIKARLLHHENNPVLNAMLENTVLLHDSAGNIKPSRVDSQGGPIGGMEALIMALALGMNHIGSKEKTLKDFLTASGAA